MAEMILRNGFELHVWARRESATQRLSELGAQVQPDVEALARGVDHLCLCVTGDEDVRDILFRRQALVNLRPGSILSLHSTVDPRLNQEVEQAARDEGVSVLDAPVSGSAAAAYGKKLLVLVGAETKALTRARPLYESYADAIIHFGPVGAGSRAKLVNNLLMIAHLGLAYRALELGKGFGLSPALLREAVLAGTGASFSMGTLGRCQEPQYAENVHRILLKDFNLANAAAASDAQSMQPLDALCQQTLSVLERLGRGEGRLI